MAAINQPLSVLTSNRPQLHEVTRRSANFHPSVWGDHFLAYASHEKNAEAQEWQEHQQLKEKVKNMIVKAPCISSQKLELINKIQRLGVSYQFEKEIEATLQLIFKNCYEFKVGKDENELYVVSLHFRLLRQHGYHVPCSVFEKFTEYDGKFKESLTNNVEAILSLYEASHLRVKGEKILDEALIFTTSRLKSMIESRRYISIYEANETHDIVLLKFAKLDFNMLQKEHQQELGNLTRWDTVLVNELPEYMRVCYVALLDVYVEMEKELAVKGESYRINYAKNEVEFEEYIKVSLVTGAYMMLSTTSIVGMQGDIVTKEALDWQQRGHVDSAVECYMKQYGKSKEETFNEFQERVSNAWKDINQECLNPTAFPKSILVRVVNLARVIDLLYKDGDTYTHSSTETKDIITSVLIDPII
nr:(-)-germacrene D synthase-like [Ipomoea batatas]